MDLLNLDDIERAERFVRLNGEDYRIAEQTVGQMMASIRLTKSAAMDDDEKMAEAIMESAKQTLPDCPEDVLKLLTMPSLIKLLTFANGDVPEEALAKEEQKEKVEGEPEKK